MAIKKLQRKKDPGKDSVSFPLRVACIDNGSNAIRFLAAEFTTPTEYREIASDRASVRMGHGVFINGRLSEKAMNAAVEALAGFQQLMETLDIHSYRAVATSAVRESSNGEKFVDRVRREAGLELEAINGSEEARLVHTAIKSRIHIGTQPWFLTDLGGGSVEVSLVDDSGMLWSESHTMGSVRLLEELSGVDEEPGRFHRVLSEYVARLKIPAVAQERRPAGLIATGGNIESLARLTGAPPNERGVTVITLSQLRTVIESLTLLGYHERIKRLGLREDRADVILPAALVYERVAVLIGIDHIHVPHVGIKEGVVLDLVDDLSGHRNHEVRLEQEVLTAAVNLGRRYLFDESHAQKVSGLARELFDQLQSIHGLSFSDRRILLASAMLHDVGSFVSQKGHHRHSQYLISHSELSGLSPREIQLVATVARFHRKSDPDLNHEAMFSFDSEEQYRIMAMASLLRLADAFDREHKQAVLGLAAQVKKSTVFLNVETDGELLLERVHFRKRAALFIKTFDYRVKVRVEAGGPVGIA